MISPAARSQRMAIGQHVALVACLASATVTTSAHDLKPMTVRDCIERTDFVPYGRGEVAVFSPDGRRFFVTTLRGALDSGELESTLWLFDSDAVKAAGRSGSRKTNATVTPRKMATFGAISNEPPISNARWTPDGARIVFLGRGSGFEHRLFAVTVADAQLEQLSPDGRDVTAFDVERDGIAFAVAPPPDEATLNWQSAGPAFPDIEIGTGQSLYELLYPKSGWEVWSGYTKSCQADSSKCPRKPTEIWQVRGAAASPIVSSETSKPVVIDQAPSATVTWAADGQSAVLTDVYLSPAGSGSSTCIGSSAISLSLATGAIQCIAPMAQYKPPSAKKSRTPFSVTLQQGLNDPPQLAAASSSKARPRAFWNPNPQFAVIDLGEASVYRWKDPQGREWTGGLVKPPGFVPGRRYPLLLQTHGFNPDEFLTDGFAPTANAARPIAGRGILVLQIGEIDTEKVKEEGILLSKPDEPGIMREGYLAAIRQLDADGLIDPHRVGIIGFSISGWYVLDAIIHAPQQFAAATVAESTYMSLGEYVLNADRRLDGKHVTTAIGATPAGEGWQKWLAMSPGLNTDKIAAPVLFEANTPGSLIYAWDIYALMRLQKKPVDLLYIRNGDHVLAKPRERLASQEMNVDWFDFWLNGHEDADSSKAAQYERWLALKTQTHGRY